MCLFVFYMDCFIFIYKNNVKAMAKKETKQITIVISPEVAEKLEEGDYNKNKLINKLLKEYLKKSKK